MKINFFKTNSISKQLSFGLFFCTVIIFVLISVIILNLSYNILLKSIDRNLLSTVRGVVILANLDKKGNVSLNKDNVLFTGMGNRGKMPFYIILDSFTGTILERGNRYIRLDNIKKYEFEKLEENEYIFWYEMSGNTKVRCIIYRDTIMSRPEDVRYLDKITYTRDLYFIIGTDMTEFNKSFLSIAIATIILLFAGLIILIIIGGAILRISLKPLKILENDVEKISPDNLNLVSVPKVEEISSFANMLNNVILELKEAFEREKRFTSNVAHELRTPVSEIRTISEVALKYDKDMDEESKLNYSDVLESAVKMQNVIASLLLLARYDNKSLKWEKDNYNLFNSVEKIISKYEMKLNRKNLELKIDISKNTVVEINENMFELIVDNLISNAVEYSSNDSDVSIEFSKKRHFIIRNYCDSISKKDITHIFERFWRKDKVRSSQGNHSGLGLSLVKSLADILNLKIKTNLKKKNLTISVGPLDTI